MILKISIKKLNLIALLACLLAVQTSIYGQASCNCSEVTYVNEITDGGEIHKYEIGPDGEFTEILNATTGSSWFNNNIAGENVINPHGVGVDLNGQLYVGSSWLPNDNPVIRKFNCDGEIIPAADFEVPTGGQFNMASSGSTIFINNANPTAVGTNDIMGYDVCSGTTTVTADFCNNPNVTNGDWGFYLDPRTNLFYSTRSGATGTDNTELYVYSEADLQSGNCIPVTANLANLSGFVAGVTTDENGFIYVVNRPTVAGTRSGQILKYDQAYNFLSASVIDPDDDLLPPTGFAGPVSPFTSAFGYGRAIGIVYNEQSGLLYVTNQTANSDCVSAFDTSLNYLGAAVDPVDSDQFKGIAILKECCPANNIEVVSITNCATDISDVAFLNDIYGCDGPICEGLWEVDSLDPAVVFDDCTQSMTLSGSSGGCGTFTKASDGMGNNRCGAFNITFNVCIYLEPPAPVISITNNTCNPDVAGSINIDTPCSDDSTLEWSTDAGATWSAVQPTYSDSPITVRARCINDCGNAETADFATAPQECCPTVNCIRQFGDYTIQKRIP